jgi:hypothetical protein
MVINLWQLIAAILSPLLVFATIASVASFVEAKDDLTARAKAALAACVLIPLTTAVVSFAFGLIEVTL